MTDASKDSQRAVAAAAMICGGRHPVDDRAKVLITLDHTIATILIAAMGRDPKKAVAMFHEAVVPRVEERIMILKNKRR